MSIIHLNQIRNKITTLFDGKIDLSDVNPQISTIIFSLGLWLLIPYTIWPRVDVDLAELLSIVVDRKSPPFVLNDGWA